MNKYRMWQLILWIVMIAIICLTSHFSNYWIIIVAGLLVSIYVLEKHYDNTEASIILKKWLADERVRHLLEKSKITNFNHYSFTRSGMEHSFLNQKSDHVILLKEYLGNLKINPTIMKLALELYYNEINKNEANEIRKLKYDEFKRKIEDSNKWRQ